jgi:hypothetical protein
MGMKRAFLLSFDGRITSAFVPMNTPDPLRLGDRITTTRHLDIAPDIQIKSGETGTIDYIDILTGMIEIRLETVYRGLAPWDNHMWLVPYETDDILDGVMCTSKSVAIAA